MKPLEKLITFFLILITCSLFALNYIGNKYILHADDIYRVYLNGEIVGYIADSNELYNLINKKQQQIKKKYNVSKVYPPENFRIIKSSSYNVTLSTAEEVYNKLADISSFTIEGYTVKIKNKDKKLNINVLDKSTFDLAIKDFINAFISYETYESYINDTQKEVETTGALIKNMTFDEDITIKKGYIGVNEKIYTDESDLSQYLLFGENYKIQRYTVKEGDTIETISDSNKLNPQEFLIANPTYTSENSLLRVGDKVNITLINPILTFIYDVTETADTEIAYEKKVVYDKTKESSYSSTTPGVKGITRVTSQYTVKNGETQSGAEILDSKVIVEKVDEVTTKGGTAWGGNITGSYVDTGETWGWPTNTPYIITSSFGYRWGSLHEGIDISGTGYGSPIYASLDGTVINAGWGGIVGGVAGYNVVLQHDNGYYTVYAHMTDQITVSVNQRVSRGEIIGHMGMSGYATGTHLHFAVYRGVPYGGGSPFNPLLLWS